MFLDILVWFLIRLIASDADAQALQRIAPEPIALELARENVAAARVAAFVVFPGEYRADDLLSIARRESMFHHGAETIESGGRVSCGAMTPVPQARCDRQSIFADYIDGARHLQGWIAETRTRRGDRYPRALLGYAGGNRLIGRCDVAPVIVERKGVKIDLCKTADRTLWWSARIRRERDRPAS